MAIQFKAKNHKYESIDSEKKKIEWISTTSVIGFFKPPFDKYKQAKKSAKNKRSKWYGLTEEEILAAWDGENKRAITLGSWYHDEREKELLACDSVQRSGVDLQIIRPIEQDGVKLSPDQNLIPAIYPEHMCYLKSAGICGQADRVEVVNGLVDIFDYKTNKAIRLESYKNWEGKSEKMHAPLQHLDNCNFNHYALQLSIYMYIILKHNHTLKPGKMELHHIEFQLEEETNKYGYPIVSTDAAGDPIVKKVVPYKVPYLKKEVNNIIKYMKMHPDKIKKHLNKKYD